MTDRIATIISNDGVITLILDGNNYLIDKTHPNYLMIKEALLVGDADELTKLVDIPKAISTYAKGKVEVIDGEVLYNGKTIHNTLTDRILALMTDGFPFEGMLKFLENLMQNPSARAVNELYDFLDHKGFPITEDGHFLGYKGIRRDWKDKYSGKIDNSVGNVITFERNQVDDNRAHECSFGLHIGSLDYVRSYCTERVVIVKVNPKDVVSVPKDHNATKCRVCEYEVVREYTGEIEAELPKPMYQSNGEEMPPYPEDDDYRDYDDEDDPCDGCEDDCDYCEHYDW
jgi:hypothetical protein